MTEHNDLTRKTAPEIGTEDTRERILAAAAQVFAQDGYARATTRALAAAAGVNEVTLFRHFGSKEKLFAAVVESYGAPAVTTALEGQLTGDYRQDLLRLGKFFMNVVLERRDAVRLMLCEAAHFPEIRETMAQNPRLLRQMLAGYLRQQIQRGQVRPLDPEAMAQAFWGMIFSYGLSLAILAEPLASGMSPEEVVAQFVDIFVSGTINSR